MKFTYAGSKYEIIGQCNGKAVVYSVSGEFAAWYRKTVSMRRSETESLSFTGVRASDR
jgi:hypothetical protein